MANSGRDRGFALLVVLWTLALLALIVTQITAGARSEARLAANLRGAAAAEAMADGAVHEAMFRLLDASDAGWEANGELRQLRLARGAAEIRILDQAGKVNPNSAPVELLQALLRAIGADSRTAQSLAAAIADWRSPTAEPRPMGAKAPQYRAAGLDYAPPNAPFRTVAELGLVLGMTPELLARLAPHLSIYHEGDPDPRIAEGAVLQAVSELYGRPPASATAPRRRAGEVRVVAITAVVTGDDRARFVRRAVVRLGAGLAERPYQILAWERVEA